VRQNETIRLCHPIGKILKITDTVQRLKVGPQVIEIPPNTAVVLNLAGLHTHPKIWESEAHVWDPTRWIKHDGEACFENEALLPDTTRGFLGWGLGQRVCPGKRYSQVELVAALALLFRESRVEPVTDDKSSNQARLRMIAMAQDLAFRMTHEIRHGDKIQLEWKTKECVWRGS
jgi:cytochrome P450